MAAKLRKHYAALVALVVFHFVFFFPLLFMGRVVSPNDVYYNYQPWASYRPASILRVQNSLLNDPPTSYLTVISFIKDGLREFHWDPYVGSGVPGWGASSAASLTPFVLIPALLLPLAWIYTGIILLKLNVAFWFAYAWLREERLGKRGAAIGAIVVAAAGIYSVRWLWQMTNASALFPALLWVVRRSCNGKRPPVSAVALIAFSYALAGFPAAMAYGAYLVIAYSAWLTLARLLSDRSRWWPPVRNLALAGVGVLLGLLAASPALVSFAQFVRRSGYLALREKATDIHFPLTHWRSFIDPQRLGNPAFKDWVGEPSLQWLNNFWEATVYVGLGTILLALMALLNRRHQHRWFWIATAGIVLAGMFGAPFVAPLLALLPGVKYSSLSRLSLLLPLVAGVLAAGGAGVLLRQFRGRLRRGGVILAIAMAGLISADLAVFAGGFYPYMSPADTVIPATPTIRYLQQQPKPFRFVAFLSYMWPNSAELFRLEDIAAHFGSEAAYRRLLMRIDPTSWGGQGTVLQFNSLKFDIADPLLGMLGVRYLLEHREIDIVKWTIFSNTTAPFPASGKPHVVKPGQSMEQTIRIGPDPYWAIEVPIDIEQPARRRPHANVQLIKGGSVVWSRVFGTGDITALNKIYVPVKPFAREGEEVTLRVTAAGGNLNLPGGVGTTSFYYGRVAIPVIFDRELPDGRIFLNLAELPRFHAVRRVRKLNADEFLAARDVDFSQEAVITDDPVFPPAAVAQDARVDLLRYEPDRQHMRVEASEPAFVASAEKLTPELRIEIDGRPARPIQINSLFAGVVVPAGRHEVIFSRRIGRGWWWPSALAVLAIVVVAAFEVAKVARSR